MTRARDLADSADLNFDNGTLVVDQTNNRVGVGNAAPATALDVTGTVTADDLDLSVGTAGDGIQVTSAGANYLNLGFDTNRTGASQTLTQIEQKWNGTAVARISFVTGSDTTNKDDAEIRFQTASAGTPSTAMTVKSDGSVGIGTSSPTYKFQIAAGTDSLITYAASALNSNIFFDTQNTSTGASAAVVQRLITSDVAGTGSISADFQKTKAGALNINNNETNSVAYTGFRVGNNERMRIDSNGQIGLSGGASSFDTTGSVNGLQLHYDTSNGNATIGTYSNGGSTALSFHTNTGGAASTSKLQINRLGKLETTGRNFGFHNHGTIVSLADDASIVINAVTAGAGTLAIYETASGQWAVFGVGYNGAAILASLNSTTYDVIDTDGKVCVIPTGHTITIKNRLGATKGFYINMFMAGNDFAGQENKMSITFTVDKFITDDTEKLVGLKCVNASNDVFIVDKRVTIVDGTTDAEYVQQAYAAAKTEIDEWAAGMSVQGMVFNPADNSLQAVEMAPDEEEAGEEARIAALEAN